jgi:mono/diheme cytochrome c family protein
MTSQQKFNVRFSPLLPCLLAFAALGTALVHVSCGDSTSDPKTVARGKVEKSPLGRDTGSDKGPKGDGDVQGTVVATAAPTVLGTVGPDPRNAKVLTILTEACSSCHGPNGMREDAPLTSLDEALAYNLAEPGLRINATRPMPPKASNRQLSEEEKAILVEWLQNPPKVEPTTQPTVEPTAVVTAQPTIEPTAIATPQPTIEPTAIATPQPTIEPTAIATPQPTLAPTVAPTPGGTLDPDTPAALNLISTNCVTCHGPNGSMEDVPLVTLDEVKALNVQVPGLRIGAARRPMPPKNASPQPSAQDITFLQNWLTNSPDLK